MTDESDLDIAANVVVQKWLSVHWKTMKIRDIEELIKNIVQPIENIGKLKNQLSEYFIPDEYKIEGQTRSYKEYLNEIEYV